MEERFPFAYFGHGTSKVSDDFALWLVLDGPPLPVDRARVIAALPQGLRESAEEDGVLRWDGAILHVRSGLDFKYVVQQYDPEHLDWLDARLGALGDSDIARIVAEVMDDEGVGPRNPRASTWALFDAELDLWVAAVHERTPIRLLVKEVRVPAKGASSWHTWSATQAPELLFEPLHALLSQVQNADSHATFVCPMLRFCFRVRPPKKLSREVREQCVELLRVEGRVADSDVLALLVSSLPARDRAARVAALLVDHHCGVLGLFLEAKTRALLLDDDLFALAVAEAPHCAFPTLTWTQSVPARLKLNNRPMGSGLPDIPPQSLEWARRVFRLAEANGSMQAEAELPNNVYGKSVLRDWNALRSALGLDPGV